MKSIKELELALMRSNVVEFDALDLQDILQEKEFNVSKGVKIAGKIDALRDIRDEILEEYESFTENAAVFDETLDEWRDTLNQFFIEELKEYERFIKRFRENIGKSLNSLREQLSELEDVNSADF